MIFVGQNITQGAVKFAMIRRLLLGNTLATSIGAESNEHFDLVLKQ
jgi:hypothetical protein